MSLRLRRGTITEGSPGVTYGPTLGRQSVIDNAGPRTVSDPGGGITFTTRADLQTKIDANPAASQFVHAAGGTETWTTGINCGTKDPRIYFLGLAGSTATVLNGGGGSVTGFTSTAGTGYHIHGGTFTGFGSAVVPNPGIRAIRMNGPGLVTDVLCHTNTIGLTMTQDADGTIFRHCTLRDNGQYGLNGAGAAGNLLVNPTVEYCIIRHNNTGGHTIGFDSGGQKFLNMTGGTWRYNWVEDNIGYGLWWDTNCHAPVIEENVLEDNYRAGLFWENDGSSTIRRNAVLRNSDTNTEAEGYATKSNLLTSRSDGSLSGGSGISITHNVIDGTKRAVHIQGIPGETSPKNIDIYQNDIWLRASSSRVGGTDNQTVRTMFTDPTLTWRENAYHVLSMGDSLWWWPSATASELQRDWTAWRALGFDTASTRELI